MKAHMADKIRVNTHTLNNDADSVQQCIERMKRSKDNISSAVVTLDGMWDGSSSEAFKSAIQKDLNDLQTIINQLQKIHQYEVTAKDKYNACENRVGEIVRSIKI